MSGLTPSQQVVVTSAHKTLAASHRLPLGASDDDQARRTGRLEIALAQALRVIKELTEES
jgi:hypothetical protein